MTHLPGVSRWRGCFGWTAASFGILALAAHPVSAQVSPQEINAAVDKGVAHLLALQKPDGSWETTPKPKGQIPGGFSEDAKWGGETAIATYALLAAGVGPQDPKIKKAIEWLETNELHGTYAVGLRSQSWHLTPEGARNKAMYAARDRDRDFVLASRIQKGKSTGFYGYAYGTESGGSPGSKMAAMDPKGPPDGSWYDRSNSQYGVLGAWALEQAGAEIPTSYWIEEDKAWKAAQLGDGGWNYRSGGDDGQAAATYTMTSAGIATLFITQDYVMRATPHMFDSCKGGMANPNIEKGLAWMDKHINQALSNNGGFFYYGLYGIERIGVASGRKYFGTVDWFKKGSESIVHGQGADGAWGGTTHDTCFGILFLVRGRAPVMMNKVIYETASKKQVDPWNERPRDTANLAKWMGSHALDGTLLNWQIVNLKVPVDELHDAPILYMSGSEELSLSNQDMEKLREFVEQGGMIMGNADCGSKTFAQSFEKLGTKIFPKYEFRKLPASHPIFDEQYHATKWKNHPTVDAMSNGVREIMVLIPDADPGKAWQTESTKTREESFQLAGNIFLYATGKDNLFAKGDSYIVHATGEAGKEVKVARIEVGENPDPEPGAWPRLSAIMHNQRHVDVKTTMVKLAPGALAGYKIAAFTGTTKISLGAGQRQELKDFVDKGGTLIVDAAGGSTEFATSMEGELGQIFGDAARTGLASPLPLTHAIYTDPKGKIEKIAYRSFARRALTGNTHEPRVRGITVAGGRVGVFYSREDLTAALVGEPVDGIIGYEPAIAAPMVANMVMYGLEAPAAPTKPAAPATASAPPTTAPAAPTAPAARAK